MPGASPQGRTSLSRASGSPRSKLRFPRPAPIDIKHSTPEWVQDDMGSAYACKCTCRDVSDRNKVNCTINGGEKGKDGERFRSNEEVTKRRGELSNGKLFLR